MRVLRQIVLAAFLAAGFVYLTSVTHWDAGRVLRPIGKRVFTEPTSAAGAYSPDEQNNIDIYRTSRDATVSITSVIYREDWFFGAYQGKGAGSGFIINPDGLIRSEQYRYLPDIARRHCQHYVGNLSRGLVFWRLSGKGRGFRIYHQSRRPDQI